MEKKYAGGGRYVGDYSNNARNGEGTYYYTDGSIHKGSWKNNVKNGYGSFTSANGTVKTGQWKNGEYLGQGNDYNSESGVKTFSAGGFKSISKESKTEKMINNKKEKSGNLLGNLGLEFGKYTGDQLAFSPAGIAVKKKDGEYVVYDKANKTMISIGELKMDIPFYMVPVLYEKIEVGDLLKIDGSFYIVDKLEANKGLRLNSPTTGNVVNKPAKTNLYGMYFYTKIVSLLDSASGDATGGGLAGINPMMLMMLNKDGNGSGGNDMMQMRLMSQMMGGAAGGAGMNPLMMMAMMGGGDGGSDDMMQLMLMSQLSGTGINPMAGLFGQSTAPVAVAPATDTPSTKA